jgi:hypothetical protein
MTTSAPVGTGRWQSSSIDGDSARGIAEPWERAGLPTRTPGLALQLQNEQDQNDARAAEVRQARAVLSRTTIEMSSEESAAIAEDLDPLERELLVVWLAGYDPDSLRRYVRYVHLRRATR